MFDALDLFYILLLASECEVVIAFVKRFAKCNVPQMSGE